MALPSTISSVRSGVPSVFKPEPMVRVVVVGPRGDLERVILTLYERRVLHLVDYEPGHDEGFALGSPLVQAAELSETLIKLRSVASVLKVTPETLAAESVGPDVRDRILTLELNIGEEDEARKRTEALASDLNRRIEEMEPFAELGLPLETYRGYDTIEAIVGRLTREVRDLEARLPDAEVFTAGALVAVFAVRDRAAEVRDVLAPFGYVPLRVPEEDGSPRERLESLRAERAKWARRREDIQKRLDTLRERYAGFLVAARDRLEEEIEKAEAPLRFAVTDHSYVIDGWVPAARFDRIKGDLEALGGTFVDRVEPRHNPEPEEPPVLLRNPKLARPFEFLVHLYSTPSYHELDPTIFLLIAFPFFFGFMIGDAGYGALFVIIGLVAAVKLPPESDFRRLLLVIGVGGFWAYVLGLFVFGEAFGMPFHAAPGHGEELSWASLGVNVPVKALIHKAFDIADMLYLSVLFAAMHLGASFVIGFVNEVRHNKKHAVAKVGWFLCLFGIFTFLTRTLAWTQTGGWVWNVPLAWFPRTIEPVLSSFVGFSIPLASLILILGSLLALAESPIAPIEVGGLLANIMSYARLAGIGVGKAAIAAAFNTLIIEDLILTGEVGWLILGVVLLVVAQILVFLLGGISAGIQGIRLNYVESFIKFYKGNGTRFRPFGLRGAQEA